MSDEPKTQREQDAVETLELPIEGFKGTPEEIEKQWLEKVYRGRGDTMAQLTWRAVIMGSLLGGVLSLTNLYIGLKSGWGFGVAITACILSYAIWTTFYKLGLARTPMTILENNCMQSTASAAGYSTGTTLVSAFSAYILVTGHPVPLGLTLAWVFLVAVLGVTMAIPMKRQMINVEQLRFPSGLAAAETLRALHSHGEKGMRAAKALGIAGAAAALSQFLTDGLHLISGSLASWELSSLLRQLSHWVPGTSWMGRTIMFFWDPIFIAAGAITGLRVGLSMLVSGTLCWAVFIPALQSRGTTSLFSAADFKDDASAAVFVVKLVSHTNALSTYLWEQLPESTRQELQQPGIQAPRISALLVSPVDRILTSPSLYEPARFEGVALSKETKQLLAEKPTEGGALIRLNRALLQDGYKDELGTTVGYRGLIQWSLWGGTACMVAAGILSFLLQWRTSLRAFRNIGSMFRRSRKDDDALARLEAPNSWFIVGQVVSLVVLTYLGNRAFGIPYWIGALALVMSFLLGLVACRVTGETDTTPIGAMGQITQLTVGALNPGTPTTTLMSANVVSGAAISSADLLTDLKSGYLLGANPRKQFLAQFSGIFVGTLITVLSFSVLVPRAEVLGGDQFPAPAAQNWRAVSLAMSKGIGELHPVKKWSIGIGAGVGVVLAILPLVMKRKQHLIPSAAGAGLAWTFHWYYSMLFCLGGLLAWLWAKRSSRTAEEYTYPVASGVIAGGALMGVFLIFWENGGELVKTFANLFK
jgi:uncharacterized oligopeptide transporter (OPT) family protein